MTQSYGNISVKGAERDALLGWLAARKADAWVGPEAGGWCAFAEPATETFDLEAARDLMIALTRDLDCIALAVAVHNGDVLGLLAALRGRHVASYISYPAIFAKAPSVDNMRPTILGADALLAILGSDMSEMDLKRVLGFFSRDDFIYPLEIHADVIRTFALPPYGLKFGHARAEAGELPGDAADFTRIPG